MTDTTRDLIQQLADALTNAIRVIHNEDGTQHISTATPVLTEARAYLDQPEPEGLTDEELLAIQDQAVASFPPIHPDVQALSAVEYARELQIRKARAVIAADRARCGRLAVEPVPETKARELLNLLLDDLDALIDSSEGVAGLHLNGDIAYWESLRQGGRFEAWLMRMDESRAFLDSTMDEPAGARPAIEPNFKPMLKPISNGPIPPASPAKQLILRLAGELARLHDSQPSTLDLIAEARAAIAAELSGQNQPSTEEF